MLAMASMVAPMLGGIFGSQANNAALQQGHDDILGLAASNPQGFLGPTGFGITADGQGLQGRDQMDFLRNIMQQGNQQTMGGQFNNPQFQQAFNNNDMGGFFGNQQSMLNQQMGNSAFGGMGNLFNQNAGLSSMFANQAAMGPQDMTGGMMNNMFGGGMQALGNAGNQGAMMQQSLDAQRAMAAPQEMRQFNQMQDRLFAQGRLDNSGGAQQMGALYDSQFLADQQRILQAQQLGQGQQGLQQQLGMGMIGQGGQFLGQNLGQFNQNTNFANQFGQAAQGNEQQQFMQMLQAMGQNQSSGQQRLTNSMNLFGLGRDTQNQAFNQGLAGQGALQANDQMFANLFLGQQNADANRIGATGLHAQALGGLVPQQGAASSGLFGGIGDAVGGILGSFL